MTDYLARIEDLCVRRPAFELGGVRLDLARGSVVGLVGPNGAGKTTIIRALLGLLPADAGQIEVFGHHAGAPAALARIGIVLDRPTANPEWRVESLGRRLAPFYAEWSEESFRDVLDRLHVPRQQRIRELSRGQAVKLSLASALAQRPELLILDEPSSGLDPASRREIGDLIREFMVDPDHGVLFSTHITTDLDNLADELVVLVAGRVIHHGALLDVGDEFAVARGAGGVPDGPLVGLEHHGQQWSALIRMADSGAFGPDVLIEAASIDDIVIHLTNEQEVAA